MIALRLPMAVKIPLVVTVFMAAVAVFVSERVLTRFQEAQTKHLGDLAAIYLDGLASSLVDPVVREDVWEAFDIVDRARQTHAGSQADRDGGRASPTGGCSRRPIRGPIRPCRPCHHRS